MEYGVGRRGLERLMRSGEISRVRRGSYRLREPEDYTVRHRELIAATLPLLGAETVVSHTSAAILHRLPVESRLCGHVWVVRTRSHGGPSGVVRASDARVGPDEVVEVDGVLVTSVERTVLDLARTRPFDWGVAVADAALRLGVPRDDLEEAARRAVGVPGIVRGRAVVRFADPRAESAGESRSRALMHQQGIPAPELQQDIRLDGRRVGRSDFLWRHQRTVGEFDGRSKYHELVPSGQTAADVVMAEKAREQDFRDAGFWLVRWGWVDLDDPPALAARIRRAHELAPR